MRNQEEEVQKSVVTYLKFKYPKVMYCASLGGIRTSFKQAVKAKATGYVKGFPDLQICVPYGEGGRGGRGGYPQRRNVSWIIP